MMRAVVMRTLKPEEWGRLSPYLDEVLELTGDARLAWLTELQDHDPELAEELAALLALHAVNQSTAFLEHSPIERPPARTPGEAALAGQTVGAYTLEAPLGRGGMGSVWSARRSDGAFEGRVAVKLLDRRGLGPRVQEQIRREASVLARLSHPNIARLFDAGLRDNGQPYLILEFIEGERIDRYCEARRLALAARLRLMLPVIDAVGHAHLQHIVHRDLKPSNILVTSEGAVKLLDFGVASLGASGGEHAEPAETAAAAAAPGETALGMTLGYAAPEQIRGEPVCAASDVYALGILLHQLVTGRHPLGLGAGATPTRLARATLAGELQCASVCLESAASRRAVRGDLDAIILLAARRTVSERYPTAAALAEDIRNFLDGRPVSARQSGHVERAWRRWRGYFSSRGTR
jgi:serine/threonine-protein kinase